MKKNGLAIQRSIDGRLIVILFILLLLLAAGVWSTRASPLYQDAQQATGLDANAVLADATEAPQEVQVSEYEDANAGPTELEGNQQEIEAPPYQDANGEPVSEEVTPEDRSEVQVIEALSSDANGKLYYLTDFSVNGSQALTACTAGYHMASLWELYDLSNLRYNSSHPDAYVKADSGQGPPSLWYGWVRTGYNSSVSNVAGQGNCANWTSTTPSENGTIMRLTNNWAVSPGGIGSWEPDPWTCGGTAPIWCIED
jgi:hypothetical protein